MVDPIALQTLMQIAMNLSNQQKGSKGTIWTRSKTIPTRRWLAMFLAQAIFSPTFRWIDLRENLQETMVFTIKFDGLSCKFSHHPILWTLSRPYQAEVCIQSHEKAFYTSTICICLLSSVGNLWREQALSCSWLVVSTILKNHGVRQWEGWHPICGKYPPVN